MHFKKHLTFALASAAVMLALVFAPTAVGQETDDCRCACVDDKVEAVFTSTTAIRPVCVPRVCDVVLPSIKPIEAPTIPPIGTNKCDMKQVLNEQTHEYEWKRLCYKADDPIQNTNEVTTEQPRRNLVVSVSRPAADNRHLQRLRRCPTKRNRTQRSSGQLLAHRGLL